MNIDVGSNSPFSDRMIQLGPYYRVNANRLFFVASCSQHSMFRIMRTPNCIKTLGEWQHTPNGGSHWPWTTTVSNPADAGALCEWDGPRISFYENTIKVDKYRVLAIGDDILPLLQSVTTKPPEEESAEKDTCARCGFWDFEGLTHSAAGVCRRHSPAILAGEDVAIWPPAHPNDWCGDFEEKGGTEQ